MSENQHWTEYAPGIDVEVDPDTGEIVAVDGEPYQVESTIYDRLEQHRDAANEGATVTLSPAEMLEVLGVIDAQGEALAASDPWPRVTDEIYSRYRRT